MNFVSTYAKNYRGLSVSAWHGIVLNLIESSMIGVFYFLSIYFVTELHFTIATAGMIIACYGVGAIPGGLFGGKLSDRFSPPLISATCLFIQALGYFALIKLSNCYFLMFNMFVLGCASYGFITANSLFVLQQCEAEEAQRLKSINLLSTTANLGLGLSALIIGQISQFGFHIIFLTSSSVLFLLACHVYRYQSAYKKEKKISEPKSISEQQATTRLPFVLFCVFLVGMIISQLSATYPLYIKHTFAELGMQGVSILFFLNTLLVILCEVPIGQFVRDFNKILLLGIGSFFIGLGMFLLSMTSLFVLAMLSCVIYTLGEIIFFSVAQLVCYQNSSTAKKGHSLGLFRMIFASSRVMGPLLGGYVYYHFGGQMLWYVSGWIGVGCLLGCFYFKTNRGAPSC